MPTKGLIYTTESINAMLAGTKTQTLRLSGLQLANAAPDKWVFLFLKHELNWTSATFQNLEAEGLCTIDIKCPYGIQGDQIYAKETWRTGRGLDGYPPNMCGPMSPFQYKADMATIREDSSFGLSSPRGSEVALSHGLRNEVTQHSPGEHSPIEKCSLWGKWRSPLFMPRLVARPELFRTITKIGCTRVQEISLYDIVAEGYPDLRLVEGQKERLVTLHRRLIAAFPKAIAWYANIWNSLHAKPKAVRGGSEWAKVLGWKWASRYMQSREEIWQATREDIVGYVSFPFAEGDGDHRNMIQEKPHKRCVNPWAFGLTLRGA